MHFLHAGSLGRMVSTCAARPQAPPPVLGDVSEVQFRPVGCGSSCSGTCAQRQHQLSKIHTGVTGSSVLLPPAEFMKAPAH